MSGIKIEFTVETDLRQKENDCNSFQTVLLCPIITETLGEQMGIMKRSNPVPGQAPLHWRLSPEGETLPDS